MDVNSAASRSRLCLVLSLALLVAVAACASKRSGGSDASASAENKTSGVMRQKTMPMSNSSSGVAKGTQANQREVALLAGGCFWGMEEILRDVPGVIETEVGYTGGRTESPSYEDVKSSRTGHAEAVRVVFDPTKLSYAELLEKWFFRMHDPTTKNRQGNDIGTQYRSAIFVSSPEQRRIAEQVKRKVDDSDKWSAAIVTEIVQAGAFTPAESYHQDYLRKNPGGYTCHYLRDWSL